LVSPFDSFGTIAQRGWFANRELGRVHCAITSVGNSHIECGGKRSATPLWLVFVPCPSQDVPLSQSGVALRLPPHSIKSRSVTDSFITLAVRSRLDKHPGCRNTPSNGH